MFLAKLGFNLTDGVPAVRECAVTLNSFYGSKSKVKFPQYKICIESIFFFLLGPVEL